MAVPTYKNSIGQATATTGTGTVTLGAATSGYSAFAAGDNGLLFDVVIIDGTSWEVARECTYTHSGTTLTRGTLEASSTGSALNLSGSATVYVTQSAERIQRNFRLNQAITPGGRLTLESGVPVSTTNQTAKSTIYYTPYVHDVITLWDSANWVPTTFTETSLALSGLTSGKNYDVFGYLSSGALAIELLVWTNDTARATAVTLQDGRYCKSGDKTRLYLGTIRTTSTTTTEDSGFTSTTAAGKRFVWNAYNRVKRAMAIEEDTASWTLASPFTTRQVRAQTDNQVEAICGMAGESAISLAAALTGGRDAIAGAAFTCIGYDGTSTLDPYAASSYTASYSGSSGTPLFLACMMSRQMELGYHYWTWLEGGSGSGSTTTYYGSSGTIRKSQMAGWVEA